MWASGVRWDWDSDTQGLVQDDRVYRNEFRTLPDPTQPLDEPFTFAVIGDFGTGMRRPSTLIRRQREVARALERAVRQDDVDDREQVMDNLYLRERLATEEAAGRASLGPGLFYRFRVAQDVEFVCIDTSKEHFFRRGRLFEYPKHQEFLRCAFPRKAEGGIRWRIPFCHHPPYSAGPQHYNTDGMDGLIKLFELGGVRTCFSGHEHNFQHSRWKGIDYFVSGAGGKVRLGKPDGTDEAHTESWAPTCHFLLVRIDGDTMTVRAIGSEAEGMLIDITRFDPAGRPIGGPIEVPAQ